MWCNRRALPVYYTYVPNKKKWEKVLKEYSLGDIPFPETAARCTTFTNEVTGETLCLVTVNRKKCKTLLEITGVLAHEAYHVFYSNIEAMGEESPSEEFSAYSIQFIYQNLFERYLKCHKLKSLLSENIDES